jgi:predicted nucleotidyltransferase
MLPLIDTKRAEIAELCRRYHVRRLEVFGSAAQGDFDPQRSDVDFLVEFDPDHRANAFDDYFELKENLESLLGRSVDLVVEKAIRNPYFRASVERTREPVYATRPRRRTGARNGKLRNEANPDFLRDGSTLR